MDTLFNQKKKRKRSREAKGGRCSLKYNSAGYLLDLLNFGNCENHECECDEYKCEYDGYCIPLEKFCDGISHCPFNDDEDRCS